MTSSKEITTNNLSPSPEKKRRPNAPKIPTPKQNTIITLKRQNPGAPSSHIAKLAGADISYTIEVLKKYGLIAQDVEEFKSHRADVFAGLQSKLIKSITQSDIEKAPIGTKILAACQIYDKERIERGKSTSNIVQLHADIAEIRKMSDKINLDEIEAETA